MMFIRLQVPDFGPCCRMKGSADPQPGRLCHFSGRPAARRPDGSPFIGSPFIRRQVPDFGPCCRMNGSADPTAGRRSPVRGGRETALAGGQGRCAVQ